MRIRTKVRTSSGSAAANLKHGDNLRLHRNTSPERRRSGRFRGPSFSAATGHGEQRNCCSDATGGPVRAGVARMLRTAGRSGSGVCPHARKTASARWWPSQIQFPLTEIFHVSVSDLKRGQRTPRVFTVRRAEEQDLPALQKYFAAPERVRDRFRRGDVCVMTLLGGEIGAAVWLAAGPASYYEDWDDLRCVSPFRPASPGASTARATSSAPGAA